MCRRKQDVYALCDLAREVALRRNPQQLGAAFLTALYGGTGGLAQAAWCGSRAAGGNNLVVTAVVHRCGKCSGLAVQMAVERRSRTKLLVAGKPFPGRRVAAVLADGGCSPEAPQAEACLAGSCSLLMTVQTAVQTTALESRVAASGRRSANAASARDALDKL